MVLSAVVLRTALRAAAVFSDDAEPATGALASFGPWNLALRHPDAAALVVLIAGVAIVAVAFIGDRAARDLVQVQRALRRTLWYAAVFYALYAGVLLQLVRASADWPIGAPARIARRLLFASAAMLWGGLALLLGAVWRRYSLGLSNGRAAAS